MSSLLPPGTRVYFLSRIGFSIPTAHRLSSNVAKLTLSRFSNVEKLPTSMHSVAFEPTKLILISTRTTYQATGDAGLPGPGLFMDSFFIVGVASEGKCVPDISSNRSHTLPTGMTPVPWICLATCEASGMCSIHVSFSFQLSSLRACNLLTGRKPPLCAGAWYDTLEGNDLNSSSIYPQYLPERPRGATCVDMGTT